ncbi:MAG TPA: hypothetical protein VK165_04610 [Azonexus sp.]|nr:hypothetical protein [Azonexus sp.]
MHEAPIYMDLQSCILFFAPSGEKYPSLPCAFAAMIENRHFIHPLHLYGVLRSALDGALDWPP